MENIFIVICPVIDARTVRFFEIATSSVCGCSTCLVVADDLVSQLGHNGFSDQHCLGSSDALGAIKGLKYFTKVALLGLDGSFVNPEQIKGDRKVYIPAVQSEIQAKRYLRLTLDHLKTEINLISVNPDGSYSVQEFSPPRP